jgi:hypothetical protein
MKSINKIAVIILGSTLTLMCKKELDQPPIGLVDESKMANKKGVEGLLIGAYSLLDGAGINGADDAPWGSAGSNWVYGSICGSEGYKGSEFKSDDQAQIIQIERFETTAQNPDMDRKWSAVYAGVQRANTVLRVMKKATDIGEQDQRRIAAEARFLRGFYHLEAAKIWNKVPYVDESVTYESNNFHLPNDTIWGAIESDFRFAMNNLPQVMNEAGRVNNYAAMAFLVKALLFQQRNNREKLSEAKVLLDSLINYGVTATGNRYGLLPHYSDNFNIEKKNSYESVFAAQASVNDGGYGLNGNQGDVLNFPMGGPAACCGFFQPSQFLVDHFKTNPSTGLPDLENFNDPDVKNDEGRASTDTFTIYSGTLDPRIDWTVGRRGIPFLDWGDHPGKDWIRQQQDYGPYSPIKNTYYKSQEDQYTQQGSWTHGSTANNINLLRFADVLLWAAEVEIEIGELSKAMDYINRVRSRAADPTGWVSKSTGPYAPYAANYKIGLYSSENFTRENALKIVRYERMLELGMEGQRFFDLVRWGIAEQEINAYLKKEMIKRIHLRDASFHEFNEYFPIPQKQIDLSAGSDGIPKMKQNPGY